MAAVGYPASRRFQWEGFTVQVFQRVIFQWHADSNSVAYVNVFDRLHYAMASTAVPPFLIAAAVVVEEDWTQPAINALLIAVALFLINPVLANATARAARTRRFGQVEARPEERPR